MTYYEFVKRLDDNIVVMSSEQYGEQLWSKCKTRKSFTCKEYNIKLPAGTMAYRPQTNGYNRMERISEHAMKTTFG